MFVAQLFASILVWGGVIWALQRRRKALIDRFKPVPRGRRAASAVSLLLSSIAVLVLMMGALAGGGMVAGRFVWWGWIAATLGGAVFVALQTLALVPLVLNAVTREGDGSSDRLDRP